MVGSLVAEAAVRSCAEAGDLCAAIRMARRPTDVRICLLTVHCWCRHAAAFRDARSRAPLPGQV